MLKLALLAALALLAPSELVSGNSVHVEVNVGTPTQHHLNHNNHHQHHENHHQENNEIHPVHHHRAPIFSNNLVSEADLDEALFSDDPLTAFKQRTNNRGGGGDPQLQAISKHATYDNCWIRLNGEVLDITRFDHPFKGGLKHIAAQCGHDSTQGLHGLHQAEYDEQMKMFVIDYKTGKFRMDQHQNPLSFDGDDHDKLAHKATTFAPPKPVYVQQSSQQLGDLLNQL